MEGEILCPRPFWEELLREGLHPQAEERTFWAPAGLAWRPERIRLLVRGPFQAGRPAGPGPVLRVSFRSGRPASPVETLGELGGGELILGRGPAEGRWAGWIRRPGGPPLPIREILLPGPGMFRMAAGPEPGPWREPELRARWSRTRGALGEAPWRRLTDLRVGLIGGGRLGSTLAVALARNGVRGLVLVDPDRVELHNIGEGEGYGEDDLGRPKVEALARHLAETCPWTHVEAIPFPVERWAALHALKLCDLLICTADTASGRVAAGELSALYLLPLIEAGTGVFASPAGDRRLGLEVRLILPWEVCRPCLEEGPEGDPGALTPWWADRMGSLRSLNLTAAGLTLMLLEGFICEEVTRSTAWVWTRDQGFRAEALAHPCGRAGCLRRRLGVGDAVFDSIAPPD
ncbi:MAG: ThiF family adenylyltransferase [Thermoflexus sp.]